MPAVRAMRDSPRIAIVDDDAAFADSLGKLLESDGFAVTAFPSAEAFLDRCDQEEADCLFLDVRMPHMNGLDLQKHLRANGFSAPIIVMTGEADIPTAVRAMKQGALDFLQKPIDERTLFDAVYRALDLADDRSRRIARRDAALARYEKLTPREKEVFAEMLTGQPNKVIAHRLGASPRTIEVHRARVLRKMDATNLSRLVRMSMEAGIQQVAGDADD